MIKMVRENKILRCNVICKVCKSPFEFIEDKDGEAIITNINLRHGKEESMGVEFNAKCSICGYRAKYNGELDII